MAADYLGGEQSPVLKKTPIASASLERDRKMDGLINAPSTMMCSSLMVRPGLDRSTCCQRGFLVNPLAWLVSDLRAMIPETVGPPPSESYARWDAHSCGWKTSQASLLDLMGISAPSSVNFTKTGMMRSGELSALPQLVHPINETGFGSSRTNQTLWPTPTVNGNNNHKGASKKAGDGLRTAVVLDAMGFWPRPETQNPSMKGFEVGNTCTVILDSQPWDSMYARGIIWGINGEMIDVQMECGQIECWPRENVIPTGLPTPTKNDAKKYGQSLTPCAQLRPTGRPGPWAFEPRVDRLAHGLAHRRNRVGIHGNGQVPQQMVAAFCTMFNEAIGYMHNGDK